MRMRMKMKMRIVKYIRMDKVPAGIFIAFQLTDSEILQVLNTYPEIRVRVVCSSAPVMSHNHFT